MDSLTGIRYLDWIILLNLSDRDLLNSLSLNKRFESYGNDENFWRQRFQSVYPVNVRPEGTWKDLYLGMARYYSGNLNEALGRAIKDDNIEAIKFFIRQGADDMNVALLNEALGRAAEDGNMEAIEFFMEQGADDMNAGLLGTAKGKGDEEEQYNMAMFFIENGADNFDYSLFHAGFNGSIFLFHPLLQQGGDESNIIFGVIKGNPPNKMDIIEYYVNKDTPFIEAIFNYAYTCRNLEVIEYLKKIGVFIEDVEWAHRLFYDAASDGDLDLVKYSVENGMRDYSGGMITAAESGHLDLVKYFLEIGANYIEPEDIEAAFVGAAEGGYTDLVEYFLEIGAKDIEKAMRAAAEGGHTDLLKYLLKGV